MDTGRSLPPDLFRGSASEARRVRALRACTPIPASKPFEIGRSNPGGQAAIRTSVPNPPSREQRATSTPRSCDSDIIPGAEMIDAPALRPPRHAGPGLRRGRHDEVALPKSRSFGRLVLHRNHRRLAHHAIATTVLRLVQQRIGAHQKLFHAAVAIGQHCQADADGHADLLRIMD